MGIVIVLQYRGEKARLFDVYREDAPKYLDGFFGDDLRRLKLPTPHEYRLKAWYASRILCRWETWGDKDINYQLLHAIDDIKEKEDCLAELEM
ncbi:hypothetical protein FOMPIDRAFT_1054598 [Fomitopsis schrenkii]|uniref:Uncharacterized protein n=1 Tax=Fomitopsis schrenkii TaxID=2126942 RepID=S8DQL2_FOMSC|nr:hypothetical protein FOMPIDRAFT_1054598 [Fomitopsis schrenkii]